MEPARKPLPSGATMAVLRGDPTDEELAAVATALDATVREARARVRPPRPAWSAAARVESLGAKPVASPADLRVAQRPFN